MVRWLTRRRILVGCAAMVGALLLAALALWWSLPDVEPLRTANPASTAFIDLRRSQAADRGRVLDVRWSWRPLARISPLLQRAVVHAEDARFFEHEGVDWEAVKKTAEQDWKSRSLRRGGSTITQQLAKNLYLSPRRSPIRKLRELLIAWRLEAALDKERILEIYLNIAEWGDGVFGAEAAARRWYGRSAARLTADQAARLAVALPNPFDRSPRTRSRRLDRKAARIVRALHRGGLISVDELGAALRALGQAPTVVAPAPAPGELDDELPEAPAAAPDEQAPAADEPASHDGGALPTTGDEPDEPDEGEPTPGPPAQADAADAGPFGDSATKLGPT
jgi:monofunctional biosynthetic peptidoglycan transglycosylase